jgi:hypothetical protein
MPVKTLLFELSQSDRASDQNQGGRDQTRLSGLDILTHLAVTV